MYLDNFMKNISNYLLYLFEYNLKNQLLQHYIQKILIHQYLDQASRDR